MNKIKKSFYAYKVGGFISCITMLIGISRMDLLLTTMEYTTFVGLELLLMLIAMVCLTKYKGY